MNSSFKIEDASEGSPFGFDTTYLQDYPVEIKGADRLKKTSKSKRLFESRLLVDPYLLSRQVENGKLSATVKKLFIEPYTLVFTSEDYDSDEQNDFEKQAVGSSLATTVDKIENRIKASPLGVNNAERTYEPPNKKKKIVDRESSELIKPNEFAKSSNAVPAAFTPQPSTSSLERNVTPSAEKIANTVAKDIAARMGKQIAAGVIQGSSSPTAKPPVSAIMKSPQENKLAVSSPKPVIGQPGAVLPQIQNDAQKVQVRLSDGRILLMSRDLYLKLRESGPANNASLTAVEQRPVQQQAKPSLTSSTSVASSGSTPSSSAVRPNCVLRLPNSQAVNGTLDNLLTFMRENNLASTAQKQNAPGPRFIIQHRPVVNNVKQPMPPAAVSSSAPQIKIVAAQGGSNARIIVNPGSSLSDQLSKIQQLQTKSTPAGQAVGTAPPQPLRVVTTQRVVQRHAIVPSSGAMVQQRPTSYIVTSRVGQGQIRLPVGAQNQPVRLCLVPAARNVPGAAPGTSQTPNFVVMNSPGNIRQVNFNNLVKINTGVSGQNSPLANLTQSAGPVVIQRPQNLIFINGQQQQVVTKPNLLQVTNKTT